MLKSVRYFNFKKYKDVTLNLEKKVTILVGPNSSGKSSLIKGILAFKQTYGDPADHAGFVAQGNFVDIGNFVEYTKDHDIQGITTFVFEIKANILLGFKRESKCFIEIEQENDPQTGHGRTKSYTIYITDSEHELPISDYSSGNLWINFQRMKKMDESYRVELSRDLFELTSKRYHIPTDEKDFEKLSKYLKSGAIQGKRDNNRGMSISWERGDFPFEVMDKLFPLERLVTTVHSAFYEKLTEKTFALASLREKPIRSMPLTDERQVVGPTGAHTASVYHDLRQRSIKAGKKNSKLKEDFSRLEGWFKRLKLGLEIEINSWRDLVDLRTKTAEGSAKSESIVDVGVGFSQASPILVQLAAMPDYTMLIVEQPELHLYPWAQTRMGEVLCEESFRGDKNIIIETHSEHIIHGVQLHISNAHAGKIDGLSHNDVQIIYVDENARLNHIGLTEFGELTGEWPSGFFDQTLTVYKTILENKIK